MSDLGDRALGSTVDFKFTGTVNGVPTNMVGPVIDIFASGTTAPITSGITLTTSWDGFAGLNDVSIVATSGNGFAAGEDYDVVMSGGTLGGIGVAGWVIGHFSLNLGNVATINDSSGAAVDLSAMTNAVPRGTVTTGASTTSVPTSAFSLAGSAASGVVSNQFVGGVLFDGNTTTAGLRGSKSAISASSASNTPTLTVGALPATPASGDTFSII